MNKSWFPINKYLLQKATSIFKKYGKWSLLLSWVPFIGDPIAFAAGTFRYNVLFFLKDSYLKSQIIQGKKFSQDEFKNIFYKSN